MFTDVHCFSKHPRHAILISGHFLALTGKFLTASLAALVVNVYEFKKILTVP